MMVRYLSGLFLLGLGFALSAALQAQWQAGESVEFDYSPRLQFDRINRQYLNRIRVTNHSQDDIVGPLRVVIENSSHQVLNSQT